MAHLLPRRLVLALPALALSHRARAAEPLVIGGSGPVLAAARLLVEGQPGAEVLDSLGTRGGLQALRDGTIQLALFARPPNAEERAAGMQALHLGDSPLVAATRAGPAPPAPIEIASLMGLMDGSRPNWPDGRPVTVIRRTAPEIDNAELASVSPEMAAAVQAMLARPGPRTARTAQNNGEAIEREAGTLGFITLGQAMTERRQIAQVPVQGLADGRDWLVMKRFFVAHMADATAPVVALARRMAWEQGGARLGTLGFRAAILPQSGTGS
ncbi:substrate-binding domain-containing protein [Falsiroseomonas sp.]|uniref:substrate-binding domain-containing protein n=1 Tax=Falsiroseomonas sp. TaxID=2870721 RepID=UPI003F6FEA18